MEAGKRNPQILWISRWTAFGKVVKTPKPRRLQRIDHFPTRVSNTVLQTPKLLIFINNLII